jgi:PmbA protein
MSSEREAESLAIVDRLLKAARAHGAQAADAVMFDDASLSVDCRMGEMEDVGRSESRDIGLRVIMGRRQACVSGTDMKDTALDLLAERAVAMARLAPEDPYCGLADATVASFDAASLQLDDGRSFSAQELFKMAKAAEDVARAPDGITNSEGAGAGWSRTTIVLGTSTGFRGAYSTGSHSISACVLAGEGLAMERDYDYATARHFDDLESPEEIGANAARRTLARLNSRKVKSARVPVVFDPRAGNSMLGHLLGAINGAAISRGTSFLKDRMGKQVFANSIQIIDDPRKVRGLRSRPFDAEGAAAEELTLIADGVLQCWLLDTAAARQLGLKSNGRASRSVGAPPSPGGTNSYMAPGMMTPGELMADIKDGFYVTDMIGMGVNGVTGDYSRGAAGFWIENGEISYPVSEVTIAGNLKDMFMALTPANDLEFRYSSNTPTIRIEGMTLAGA